MDQRFAAEAADMVNRESEMERGTDRAWLEFEHALNTDLRLLDRLDSIDTLTANYLEAQLLVKSYTDTYRLVMDQSCTAIEQIIKSLKSAALRAVAKINEKKQRLGGFSGEKATGLEKALVHLGHFASLDEKMEPSSALVGDIKNLCNLFREDGFELMEPLNKRSK